VCMAFLFVCLNECGLVFIPWAPYAPRRRRRVVTKERLIVNFTRFTLGIQCIVRREDCFIVLYCLILPRNKIPILLFFNLLILFLFFGNINLSQLNHQKKKSLLDGL
jgi:hypothetical protein